MTRSLSNSSDEAIRNLVAAKRSPFHEGERALQTALGVRETVEKMGQRVIRDHLPIEHGSFYSALTYILIGSVDNLGRPWASMLTGRAGLMQIPDSRSLTLNALPHNNDALKENLKPGSKVGLLGIDYANRRRNRLSGAIRSARDGQIQIDVHQTFGNCPMYIQARDYQPTDAHSAEESPDEVEIVDQLDDAAKQLITCADNFTIASHNTQANDRDVRNGVDVSHRGGKPGFVRINSDTSLTFPDFRGNRHFNTLGNIAVNGRAGLLFIDFLSGDVLQLTGSATIDLSSDDIEQFKGAQRLVHFTLEKAIRLKNAIPGRWQFIDYSPALARTGSWASDQASG